MKKYITEDETVIAEGFPTMVDGVVRYDPVSERLNFLQYEYLQLICADPESGWNGLYIDLNDGRLWDVAYPNSGYHGGGNRILKVISRQDAIKRYGKKAIAFLAYREGKNGLPET